jgi:hypothetical protein
MNIRVEYCMCCGTPCDEEDFNEELQNYLCVTCELDNYTVEDTYAGSFIRQSLLDGG